MCGQVTPGSAVGRVDEELGHDLAVRVDREVGVEELERVRAQAASWAGHSLDFGRQVRVDERTSKEPGSTNTTS